MLYAQPRPECYKIEGSLLSAVEQSKVEESLLLSILRIRRG
jgi:hypothetical protein